MATQPVARMTVTNVPKNHKRLVKWLRNLADHIEKHPKEYTTTRFIARLFN